MNSESTRCLTVARKRVDLKKKLVGRETRSPAVESTLSEGHIESMAKLGVILLVIRF